MEVSTLVKSVAHHVPKKIVSNHDLAELMDTSDEWIRERTGISERRFAEEGLSASELGLFAARKAIERAEISIAEIDLIIGATLSPDFYFPGIAAMIQEKLGLGPVPGLDIRVQCSGFVYGIATADAFIRSGQAKCVLLVCSEVQSAALELNDRGRDMAVLFGDGAGAVVLAAAEGRERASAKNRIRGLIDSNLGSDGSGAEMLCLKVPGSANPGFLQASDYEEGTWHPQMDGRQVFRRAVTEMSRTASQLLAQNGLTADDIDLLVPHQANMRINESVREHLGLKEDQVFNNIERYGNTTAATIPICLSEAEKEGRLEAGSLVLTLAFGAGFTWGANLIRW